MIEKEDIKMCNNECVSEGICKHNEECYDDVCFTSEQLKVIDKWLAESRNKTIEEIRQIINKNMGGDAWTTIKQVLNNKLEEYEKQYEEENRMSIKVQEFKHIPGVNDAEYIKLLEHHLDIAHQQTSKAIAEIRIKERNNKIIYNQALEDLKNNILKGVKEDKDFASMQIKDANWEEYIKVFSK